LGFSGSGRHGAFSKARAPGRCGWPSSQPPPEACPASQLPIGGRYPGKGLVFVGGVCIFDWISDFITDFDLVKIIIIIDFDLIKIIIIIVDVDVINLTKSNAQCVIARKQSKLCTCFKSTPSEKRISQKRTPLNKERFYINSTKNMIKTIPYVQKKPRKKNGKKIRTCPNPIGFRKTTARRTALPPIKSLLKEVYNHPRDGQNKRTLRRGPKQRCAVDREGGGVTKIHERADGSRIKFHSVSALPRHPK